MFDLVVKFKISLFLLCNIFHKNLSDNCPSLIFKNKCKLCDLQEDQITLEDCGNQVCQEVDSQAGQDGVFNTTDNHILEIELSKIIEERNKTKTLKVENLILNEIPLSICKLQEISDIQFKGNCLRSLPDNCLNKLTTLTKLAITENKIKKLQKGLFDGLNNLREINLKNNDITYVDDELFSNVYDLLLLTNLDLSYNKIEKVDAWIFIRGVAVLNSYINLRDNIISVITNTKKWSFTCKDAQKKHREFHLSLYRNNVKYISDLTQYFPKIADVLCFFGKSSHSKVEIEFDHNHLYCDCTDYKILKIIRKGTYISMFDGVHCYDPVHLRHERLLAVPLSSFQCELTCPEGCKCMEQPSEKNIIVNCGAGNYPSMSLPKILPNDTKIYHVSNYEYNLTFSQNSIKIIENLSYLNRTKVLDLGNNLVGNIDAEVLMTMMSMQEVYLHSNLLTDLPKEIFNNTTLKLKKISLYDNPWNCSCENIWLKTWMINLNKSVNLLNQNSILCQTPQRLAGKSIFSIDDIEFCEDPYVKQRNQILMCLLIPLFSILLIVVAAYLIIRKLKVLLYTRFNFHPFDRDECDGEYMEYDAFVSCAYSDRNRGIEIVRLLEAKGYRICYHEKDFVGGQSIASNIVQAVMLSKRVICVMTIDFIDSSYCMFEFQTSMHRNIETNRKRLIILLDKSIKVDTDSLPIDVYNFLTSHTYIEMFSNANWIDQLFYSLPINHVKQDVLRTKAITESDILIT